FAACGGTVAVEQAGATTGAGGSSSGASSSSASSSSSVAASTTAGSGGAGLCTPVPTDCDTIAAPACGCDQKAYVNGCYANMAGTDIDALGGCTPPAGMFGCGFDFCEIGAQYCEVDPSSAPGMPATFRCKQAPQGCDEAPTCACIAALPCATTCTST